MLKKELVDRIADLYNIAEKSVNVGATNHPYIFSEAMAELKKINDSIGAEKKAEAKPDPIDTPGMPSNSPPEPSTPVGEGPRAVPASSFRLPTEPTPTNEGIIDEE